MPVGTASTASIGCGAPVVRNVVRPVVSRMLTVREVAEELAVCRATVYALLERGELERVWIGRSIRISAASLEALAAARNHVRAFCRTRGGSIGEVAFSPPV